LSPLAIGIVVFACSFGGALIGMMLRSVLPEHHLSEESKDVVKLVSALIATLAALVLGLLIASAKSSFDAVNEGLRQSAAKIVLIDRTLAQFGPEARELRETLRRGYAVRIEQLFSERSSLNSAEVTRTMEDFQRSLRALSPQNEVQRSLQTRALDLSYAIAEERWLAIEHQENSIPGAFIVVLVFWLAAMFASFGLFAPRNGIVLVAFVLGALSLAGAVFLVEELNDPFGGVIAVSRAPMDNSIPQLGR